MQRQSDLLQMIRALSPSRCFARGLHRGKEKRDQYANNRDDHQKLDQRESASHKKPVEQERWDRRSLPATAISTTSRRTVHCLPCGREQQFSLASIMAK
jgi:hypothetical protein